MDFAKQVEYWLQSAEHDLETAKSLIKEKKYDWALFIGHLILEKTLKAIFIQRKNEFPEKTHNLIRLADLTDIGLNEDDTIFFEQVNSFHISSRYPDEQFKFYNLCDKKFALKNFQKIMEKYKWLKEKLKHL